MKLNDANGGSWPVVPMQRCLGAGGLLLLLFCIVLHVGQTAHAQLVSLGDVFFSQQSTQSTSLPYRQLRNPLSVPPCSASDCPALYSEYLAHSEAASPAITLFRHIDVSLFNGLSAGLETRPWALLVLLALAVWGYTLRSHGVCWRQPATVTEHGVHESIAMLGYIVVAGSCLYYANLHHTALVSREPIWVLLGCATFFLLLSAVHGLRLWGLRHVRYRLKGRLYPGILAVAPMHSLVLLAAGVLLAFGSHWAGFGVYLLTFGDYANIFLGLALWLWALVMFSACRPGLAFLHVLGASQHRSKNRHGRSAVAVLGLALFLGVVLPGSLLGPYWVVLDKSWTPVDLHWALFVLFALTLLGLLGHFAPLSLAGNFRWLSRIPGAWQMGAWAPYWGLALAVWGLLSGLLGLPLSLDTAPVFAAFLALVWLTWERMSRHQQLPKPSAPLGLWQQQGLLALTHHAMVWAGALALLVFASMALAATLGRGVLPALMALPQPWPPGVVWVVVTLVVLLAAAVLEPFGFVFLMALVLGPWVHNLGVQSQHWFWAVCVGAALAAVCPPVSWRLLLQPRPWFKRLVSKGSAEQGRDHGFGQITAAQILAFALCFMLAWAFVLQQPALPLGTSGTTAAGLASPPNVAASNPGSVENSPQPKPKAALLLALQAWAKAWSAQDVEAYLGFYAPHFQPQSQQTRQQWAAQRRIRILNKQSIVVELEHVEVAEQGKLMRVRFSQRYQSERLQEYSRKEMLWEETPQGWLIVQERQL